MNGKLTVIEQTEEKRASSGGFNAPDDNPDEDCTVVESFFWYCKRK